MEKVPRLSKVQKKTNNFSQKYFLKNNNEANKQEQNIRLNPKKISAWKGLQSKTVTKNPIFHKIRQLLSLAWYEEVIKLESPNQTVFPYQQKQ